MTPSRSSGDGLDISGVIIDKETLEEVLTKHFEDSSLKVSDGDYALLTLNKR